MDLITEKQAKLISFFTFTIMLFSLFPLGLFSFIFSVLLIYAVINQLTPYIEKYITDKRARLFSTFVIAMFIIAAFAIIFTYLTIGLSAAFKDMESLQGQLTELVDQTYDVINNISTYKLPIAKEHLLDELLFWLKKNSVLFTVIGEKTAYVMVNIVIGLIIGALIALHKSKAYNPQLYLKNEFKKRFFVLLTSFQQVVFAQVKISLINTFFTSIYLAIILPLFEIHLPLLKTLILLTFVFGLLPVIGNIISNCIICLVSFFVSPYILISSLIYLVVIHKLEYFLNAKIIGSRIDSKAWELLIAMMLFKQLFGLTGLIAAPIFYAYFKQELKNMQLI